MTVYDVDNTARGELGPVHVFDGRGQEIRDLVRLDTETGEATQLVRDGDGRMVRRRGPRGFEAERREIELQLPVRVEPILVRRSAPAADVSD